MYFTNEASKGDRDLKKLVQGRTVKWKSQDMNSDLPDLKIQVLNHS